MGCIRAKGIVIRTAETGEADKYITLFSEELGKISVYAKGTKRSRSRSVASSQILCYCDFILFHYKERYTLNDAEIIESFYPLRNDIVRLTYAAHFIDLVNDVIQENLPMPRLLKLLLNSLYMLTKPERDPGAISVVFEIKTLCLLGYSPQVDRCTICGCTSIDDPSFSFTYCGCICSSQVCSSSDPYAFHMRGDTALALRQIVNSNMADVFKFGFSANVLEELKWISKQYLRERLEKDYTKLNFLKRIE